MSCTPILQKKDRNSEIPGLSKPLLLSFHPKSSGALPAKSDGEPASSMFVALATSMKDLTVQLLLYCK